MTRPTSDTRKVVMLAGGVGGSRMAHGFALTLPQGALTVIVNTGDDFSHLGVSISPDLDTQLYTLSGWVNPVTGWGRADETWGFMEALGSLGGPDWFRLGDRDLALHVERTRRRAEGQSLSAITKDFGRAFGVATHLIPMTDQDVHSIVDTDEGPLAMQDYFVRERCRPAVGRVHYKGAADARPAPGVLESLADPDLAVIVIAPSNPFLSIDPILAVPGIREALGSAQVPVIAVSPIIAGRAVKGPLAKMMKEMGQDVSAACIAAHYAGLIHGFVLDHADGSRLPGLPCLVTDTMMPDAPNRETLARQILSFAGGLASAPRWQA